jgi:hypothetical protein
MLDVGWVGVGAGLLGGRDCAATEEAGVVCELVACILDHPK